MIDLRIKAFPCNVFDCNANSWSDAGHAEHETMLNLLNNADGRHVMQCTDVLEYIQMREPKACCGNSLGTKANELHRG